MISDWNGEAFNQEPDSTNEIHGDELARLYGFEGGLVPGVTISAYLLHPAVEAWGMDFLSRGHAHVRVTSPLYDGEHFAVGITEQASSSYTACLTRPDGTVSASATVRLADDIKLPATRRGDPLAKKDHRAPAATREHFESLRRDGCLAMRFRWHSGHTMGAYLRDPMGMPDLLQGDKAFANMSYILGISNWIADGNAHMNPWVHLETKSQNLAAIPAGTSIIAEMSVVDIFEKKGHEFFDSEVNLFNEKDENALATISLRAIYRLRGTMPPNTDPDQHP